VTQSREWDRNGIKSMARSKSEETDVQRYRRCTSARGTIHGCTSVWRPRYYGTYWEYTRYMKCKRAFACSRASGKLGRVYFENCPLSLSRRITTNSFPMNFNRVNRVASTPIDATVTYVRTYVVAELTLNSRDDRPRDSTAPLWRESARKWETSRRKGTVRVLFF